MERAEWVEAFVAYMMTRGVSSGQGELRRLAEDLYATQGHLDPAVVGQSPLEMHLRDAGRSPEQS